MTFILTFQDIMTDINILSDRHLVPPILIFVAQRVGLAWVAIGLADTVLHCERSSAEHPSGGGALLTFWPTTRLSHASSTSSFSSTNSETLICHCAARLSHVVSVAGCKRKHVGVNAGQGNSWN